jgi:regulatory protein
MLRKRFSVDQDELRELSPADIEKRAQASAVRLLARREHSVAELRRKLIGRGYPGPAIDSIIARLEAKKLVADDRFVSSFVHHHAMRGQGPIRIRAQLRQQRIPDEVIAAELDRSGLDWLSLATQVLKRKFGARRVSTPAERAKRMRFLQYRGFSTDQIRAAMASTPTTESWDEARGQAAEPGIDSDLDL